MQKIKMTKREQLDELTKTCKERFVSITKEKDPVKLLKEILELTISWNKEHRKIAAGL